MAVALPPAMMMIRKSEDRGAAEHGWLHSKHTFSFANYYDPQHMGFRNLRVINEDKVEPGQGFGRHPHRDMEIISYVVDGALEHRDSMGNGSVMRPGDVQRMSAGTGVTHSEYNHSKEEPVHFLQIWIEPAEFAAQPGYEQKAFSDDDKRNRLRLVGSQDGRSGSVRIGQDVNLYASILERGVSVTFQRPEDRHLWLQVVRGAVRVGDVDLVAGDGMSTSDIDTLVITGVDDAEILLFDLS